MADYTGREEVENGKMYESCCRVGSTHFFFGPVRIERKKKKKWLTFIQDYSYTLVEVWKSSEYFVKLLLNFNSS